MGVGEGVGREVGVAVAVAEASAVLAAVGVALGLAPVDRLGEGVREVLGVPLGRGTNMTLAMKPLSCMLASLVKATVRLLLVVVQLARVLPP